MCAFDVYMRLCIPVFICVCLGVGCMYCVLVCGHMLLCVCVWVCMLGHYAARSVMHLQFYPEASG